MDNIDLGERGRLELRLKLASLLKGLEDMEGSAEFLTFEARRVLTQAFLEVKRRMMTVRYIV